MKFSSALTLLAIIIAGLCATSCSDNKSYAEQLADERLAANLYLSHYKLVNEIPADTIFQTGANAPYYRLDEDGQVYMQVLRAGSLSDRPKYNDMIYFRYSRFDIISWCENDGEVYPLGNENDMSMQSTYFMYQNYMLPTSSQYGQGIQLPLSFVGVGSELNLIVKSQYGPSDEIANVKPYHYHIKYYWSQN